LIDFCAGATIRHAQDKLLTASGYFYKTFRFNRVAIEPSE
jgi:hypothetical protein